ncbi:MAG: hypothetical protein EOM54_11620 [Clostridia bacterium]|nr:hypothetical protein [Clostridia bacterium]
MNEVKEAPQMLNGAFKRYSYNDTRVVGMQYLKDQSPLHQLRPKQPIAFQWEADNPYDENAIIVFDQYARKLGYLFQGSNVQRMVYEWLEDGLPIWSVVNKIDTSAQPILLSLKVAFYSGGGPYAEDDTPPKPDYSRGRAVRFCRVCGAQNVKSDLFCKSCGANLCDHY